MLTRRNLLLTGSVSALALAAGCTPEKPGPFVPLTPRATDIHAHFFNGLDVPVTGFITQVVLRPAAQEVKENPFLTAVIDLAAAIIFGGSTSSKDEFAALSKLDRMPDERDEQEVLAEDRVHVADGIRRFSAPPDASALSLGDPSGKNELMRQLNNLAGAQTESTALSLQVEDRADQIAGAIYDPPMFRLEGLGPQTPDQTILQLLKWAGLLTRDRRELLEEYKRLYGRKKEGLQEIEIVSPSLVDFEYWFLHKERRSVDIPNQINVMSRLAYLENDLLLLNFAPFCPLRAAVRARKGEDWLARIKTAVRTQGFAGVKLYPPMGFLPIGNTGTKGFRRGFQASGAEVDAQLQRLYKWCVEEDVPIKSHGNNSLGADVCTGTNAAPKNWNDVIARHPKLRLNVAHFGGFDETHTHRPSFGPAQVVPDCHPGDVDYEEMLSALANMDTQVYADLGYWTNVTGSSTGTREIEKMRQIIAANPTLNERIMYGSDWVMIGREKGHGRYLSEVTKAMAEVGLDAPKVTSTNALRYLGLDDPNSQQMKRLRGFFPTGHRFYEMFGA